MTKRNGQNLRLELVFEYQANDDLMFFASFCTRLYGVRLTLEQQQQSQQPIRKRSRFFRNWDEERMVRQSTTRQPNLVRT